MESLTALLVAAETGSFTAAAEALGITHGSVSRRIAVLERWLGTQLFERQGRGVQLTPAGQRFTSEAREALGLLSRSAEQWRPWRGRRTVRLSVVPSFAKIWLMPHLDELERGDLHIELLSEHRVTDLDAREADLAIRYGRGQWRGLHAALLLTETLQPAAAPAIANRFGRRPSSTALLEYPLLHDSDLRQWRAWFGEDGVRYEVRWQDRRFEDYDMVLAAAEAGLGLVLLRLPLARAWVDEGRLMCIGARRMPNPNAHYVCTSASESRPAVLELRQRLEALGRGTKGKLRTG